MMLETNNFKHQVVMHLIQSSIFLSTEVRNSYLELLVIRVYIHTVKTVGSDHVFYDLAGRRKDTRVDPQQTLGGHCNVTVCQTKMSF